MKTLTVSNYKGGVGKTTLTVHLAHFAAERGLRVLVVDLDGQCNASSSLREFASSIQAPSLFGDAPITWPDAAPGSITLVEGVANAERLDSGGGAEINAFLRNMNSATSWDLCLIDTPPAKGLRTRTALIFSDAAVSPVELDQYSFDGIKALLLEVTGIKSKYNPKLNFLGMLPSRFNTHSPAQRDALKALLGAYPSYVLPVYIALRSSLGESAAERKPVWKMDKSAAKEAGREISKVLELILKRMEVIGGN